MRQSDQSDLRRAVSLLTLKALDEDQRLIEGIASTPETDRSGDILEPKGAEFRLPMPLLWQHRQEQPIGEVIEAVVTKAGIRIKARIANVTEAGSLKTRLDEVWHTIKAGLVKGLSVGFKPLEAARIEGSFGVHFHKWLWLELSTVTVPDNGSATITRLKQLDSHALASSGTARGASSTRPGVSGVSPGSHMTTPISEQLAAARADMQQKTARLEELHAQSETEGGLEDNEQAEMGTMQKEIDALAAKIMRLATLEKAQAISATTVALSPSAPPSATAAVQRVQVTNHAKELPKGSLYLRYAMAVAAGKGSHSDTLAYAKRFTSTPEVSMLVKHFWETKAVEGTAVIQSPGWGGELAVANTAQTEFVEMLMPQTIIGKVSNFRRVPFNIPILSQTSGSTFNWVDEGNPKPVGELAFQRDALGYSKAAGIIVMTEELIRLSRPNSEELARQDMIDGCVKFLDEQFIQVGISAGNTSPASITNNVSSPAASGTDVDSLKVDLVTALSTFTAAKIPLTGLVIVTTPEIALGISLLTTPLGQTPNGFAVTPQGGTLLGYPVIVSESVDAGHMIIFKPSEIFLADDGQVRVDASNQATLDMAGSTNASFSLWQRNCVGLRVERWIHWKKRRPDVVAVIDTAAYGPSVGSP